MTQIGHFEYNMKIGQFPDQNLFLLNISFVNIGKDNLNPLIFSLISNDIFLDIKKFQFQDQIMILTLVSHGHAIRGRP